MISIIIPTYNRFPYLLNSIKSVEEQTYKNIEIIVVNDNSDDIRYKKYLKSTGKMKVIHLNINTKKKFGYPCPGHVRNIGLQNINIKTKYVAFLDDDDYWLPSKLQEQINFMEKTKCKMSSTNGVMGQGFFNMKKKIKKFFDVNHPLIWKRKYIDKNNFIICSSVLLHIDIIKKVGNFKTVSIHGINNIYEDYEYWKEALKYTDNVYVNKELIWYDLSHGTM